MTELLIFIVTAYGASNIMVFSSIFSKWRKFWGTDQNEAGFFGTLFGCMMCLPFWWGVILSLCMFSPALSVGVPNIVIQGLPMDSLIGAFFDGCLASGAVWFIHTVQERIEE